MTVYRLPTKKSNFRFPFAENKWNLSFSVSSIFCIYIFVNIYIYIYTYAAYIDINIYIYLSIYIYIYIIYISLSTYVYTVYKFCCFKRKMETQAIFLSPFNICSSCKLKFVICSFVYKETNGSYPFASRLNGLALLCNTELLYCTVCYTRLFKENRKLLPF